MLFGKKNDKDKDKRANEKMVRRVLGKEKELGRKVFGFQCSPDIQASMRKLADQMHVPLFALVEHAVQLGAIQIDAAMKDPEERESLRRHLTEVHVEMRTIEKIDRYDQEAAETLTRERIRRFDIEKVTRQLVVNFTGRGVKPEELEKLILFAHRCMLAIEAGWPYPPEISPGGYSRQTINPIKKRSSNGSETISPAQPS